MTTLVSWVGIDQRGLSSAYFASDSRITWSGRDAWNHGRKLFAARKYPHIFGYCGDVLFPTQTLSQIVEMIDAGLLLGVSDTIDVCTERVISILGAAFLTYPSAAKNKFDVLYCMREGEGVCAPFHMRQMIFVPESQPKVADVRFPDHSDIVANLGSGRTSITKAFARWKASDVGGTSRAVFSAFCDSLRSGADPYSAAPPQLVGLHRELGGKTFGIIWERSRYFYGLEVEDSPGLSDVQWFNDKLEICDPHTLARTKYCSTAATSKRSGNLNEA